MSEQNREVEKNSNLKRLEVGQDITGEVKADEKAYRWRDYQRIEPIESKRIIKQCIFKN